MSQNNTTSIPFSSSETNAALAVLTTLIINITIGFFLLLAVLLRARNRQLIYYLNIVMLMFTILLSLVSIPFEWNLIENGEIKSLDPPPRILITQLVFICGIKIITELILILRVRVLHPHKYFLLAVCVSLVALHTVCEICAMISYLRYGFIFPYAWLFVVEAFLEAANNIFFSSTFILTLVRRMRDVGHSIGGLRKHRLFFFLVLAIENMVVPCISSLIVAIYSRYISSSVMFWRGFSLELSNIGITVASIVMTTLLGSTSTSQPHLTPNIPEETPREGLTQLQTLSSSVSATKNLTNVLDEELGDGFELGRR